MSSETVALMNELFVNVKVDRAEHSDSGGIFMQATIKRDMLRSARAFCNFSPWFASKEMVKPLILLVGCLHENQRIRH
jgi:hypothetical protein